MLATRQSLSMSTTVALSFVALLPACGGGADAVVTAPDSDTAETRDALGVPFGTPIPSKAHIFDTLRKEHPRILATQEDFDRVQARFAAGHARTRAWVAELKAEADHDLQTSVIPEPPRPGHSLEASREIQRRVFVLSFMFRFTGNRDYRNRAWLELKNLASWSTWNPSHFLDVGEATAAAAIGYDWLYDTLDGTARDTLREAIVNKGLKPAQHENNQGGLCGGPSNWNFVCNGGVGLGALAVAVKEPEVASDVLVDALNNIKFGSALKLFNPDGAWYEGPTYWRYGVEYLVMLLATSQRALGSEFGISAAPGFDRAGVFRLHTKSPSQAVFNYGDASEATSPSSAMFWLARRFDNANFALSEVKLIEETKQPTSPLALLWYDDRADDGVFTSPRDSLFTAGGVVVFRQRWNDPGAAWVAFKGSTPNQEVGHAHSDVGAFAFEANGVHWATLLGADNYRAPGYFGDDRWRYYRTRAEGTNTLVLNPGPWPDQLDTANSPLERVERSADSAFAIVNMSQSYLFWGYAPQVRRGVKLFNNRSELLVQDEVEASVARPAHSFVHFRTRATAFRHGHLVVTRTLKTFAVAADRRSVVVTDAETGERLLVRVLSPANATLSVTEATSLPSSPAEPAEHYSRVAWQKVDVSVPPASSTRISVWLAPLRPGQPNPSVPGVTALREW